MSVNLKDVLPPQDDQDYDSITLSKLTGQNLTVKETEFKKLGNYDGVIFKLDKKINIEGKDWNEVHTTIGRIVTKANTKEFQDAIKDNPITFAVVSGRNDRGTWYDIE